MFTLLFLLLCIGVIIDIVLYLVAGSIVFCICAGIVLGVAGLICGLGNKKS